MNPRNYLFLLLLLSALLSGALYAQPKNQESASLPARYEELTALDFVKAVAQSGGTCLIPIGVLEKHGPHLPLGTDLLDVREVSLRAAKNEYTLVFPDYYFSQIFEAKHQPGTMSYSPQLLWNILQETCDQLARNGIKKIILVNGHGGNNSFLPYFCQAQLETKKDYAVILFKPERNPEVEKKIKALRKTEGGGHADEVETSRVFAHRPELVHADRAAGQSGENLDRLSQIPYAYTGIWWYARYPNHYAGNGSYANKEIGELQINSEVEQLAKLIKTLKTDTSILKLQDQFFKDSENPLDTKQ